jgi:hypothetical protein
MGPDMRFDNTFPIAHRVYMVTSFIPEGGTDPVQGWAIAGATAGATDETFYLLAGYNNTAPAWIAGSGVVSARLDDS